MTDLPQQGTHKPVNKLPTTGPNLFALYGESWIYISKGVLWSRDISQLCRGYCSHCQVKVLRISLLWKTSVYAAHVGAASSSVFSSKRQRKDFEFE